MTIAFIAKKKRSILVTTVALLLSLGVLVAGCTDDGESVAPASDTETEEVDVSETELAASEEPEVESEPSPVEVISDEMEAQVEEDVIRRTEVHHNGHHIEVSAVWGTKDFFQQMMPEAAGRWEPDQGFVFLITYAVHDGELPDELPQTTLILDNEEFSPFESEDRQTHPHHQTSIIRFPVSSTPDVKPMLHVGHEMLDWGEVIEIDYGEVTEELKAAEVHRVSVSDDGLDNAELVMSVGEPVILVFDNRAGNMEHHFHAMGMEPDTLFWLRKTANMSPDDDADLRGAEPLPFHLCSSELVCPTGLDIHTHAPSGDWDAIFFLPVESGEFEISCPLDEGMGGVIRVVER